MRVIRFGDLRVICGVANDARAAANVHLRTAQKVELVVDFRERLRVPRKLVLLWLECRRRDRIRAVGVKNGPTSAFVARSTEVPLVLQLELRLFLVAPFSVRPEFWLDARRVALTDGLVAEVTEAAVDTGNIGANPLAFDRVGRQQQRQILPILTAVAAAKIAVPRFMQPQANAMAVRPICVVLRKLGRRSLEGIRRKERPLCNRNDAVVPGSKPNHSKQTQVCICSPAIISCNVDVTSMSIVAQP